MASVAAIADIHTEPPQGGFLLTAEAHAVEGHGRDHR